MFRAYKYRLYPNFKQEHLFIKTMGCVRFFWNKQVEIFYSYEKGSNVFPVFKTSTQIRKENIWMKEVSAAAIQQRGQDFFEYKRQLFSPNRKTKLGLPKFKKKGSTNSYRLPNQKFRVSDNFIKIEKIGLVKYKNHRALPDGCKIISLTVSKDTTGLFFASIVVETEILKFKKTNKTIGIDVGLKEFASLSNGVVIGNPRFFRNNQAKLKKAQKSFSRKKKGSSRYVKAKLKVCKQFKKVANQRMHFLHNVSLNLIRDYDLISIESLNIAGMIKNRKLSKSIWDASFYKFFRLLKYKADWYGKEVVAIGRFEPSSKTCSNCGTVKKELLLSQRTFSCDNCGLLIDRDLNAAKNINALGVTKAKRT